MPKAKELYLAKNTEELNKLADISHKPKTIKAAITTADKLYVNAKDAQLNGDEEKAYVLYMRYYYVLKGIWKDSSYKAKKTAYDRQIGLERPGKAIVAAEQLLDSLEARYQMKNNKDDTNARNKKQRMDKPAVVDGGNVNGDKEDNDEDEYLFDSDTSLPEIPDAPSTPVENRKFSAEQIFKNNLEDPLIPTSGGNSSSVTNTQWIGNQSLLDLSNAKTAFMPSISVVSLYGQLQQKPDDVIVLDCRPSAEQLACHVNYKHFQQWIEIPEETITSGISSDSLSKHMDTGQQKLWSSRADKLIVLVDSESKSVDTAGKTSLPVIILKDAIYKFDLSCDLSQEPLLLDGGFLRWYQTYSPYCIGKITRKVTQQQSQARNDVPKQVLPDYPEFPKEEPTVFNDASDFSTTPSKHPNASVGANTADSTSYQPAKTTSPDVAERYLIPNGATVSNQQESLSTDRIVPQPNVLLPLGSRPLATDQVVPSVNIGSLGYGDMPNALPTGYSMQQPVSGTYPVQHPSSESYNIPIATSYSVQEAPGLPQANVMISPSHSQLNVAGLTPHPKQDVVLPPGSYLPSTPENYVQNSDFSPQQNISVPVLHPQQDTGPHLPGQNLAAATLGPYSQQGMATPGSHLQHSMITPGLRPQQQDVSAAPGNMMDPLPHHQHSLHPAVAPPQQQFATQVTSQNIPPPNQPIIAVSGDGWSHNPRIAYGPIPAPPTYEDAHMIPSHPPVQPPLPPPVSVPLSSSISDPHNAAPLMIPADNPSQTAPGPDHLNWSGAYHNSNAPYPGNANSSLPTEAIMHPGPAVQVAQRPADVHPPIVQPVGIQMVAPQHHHSQQNQPGHIVHHQPDPTHALRQLHAEREAALERERQERAWMEKEREELRKKQEELKVMISRSNTSEQQVMEWKQQLVAKEKELSTKEMEQQTSLQERQKLQEQKEKEISDIVQKLNAEREALERQKEQQQTELIRQQESIEQQKIAAMNEILRERDSISKQQKELSERQQNMQEQMSKWLQVRGESNNRQLHVETGLPAGWEKKFDSTTGRFYYQDHSTKTTHWNPPSNWLSYNNNSQLKQGVNNSSLQPPPQQPVSTSNSVPQPSSRPAEGSIMPPPASTPNTVPSQQPPSGVAMRKPTLPAQVPAAGHSPSTGPPAKPIPDSNKAAVVPDRSTKPQQRAPSHSKAPIKQISPQMWKQKMENLQPVHGGSMGPCLTGMKNFGNTCFMNSIIQCLCSTVPLVVHFFTGKYRYDLNMNNPISTGGRIAEEFNVIARATWYGQFRSITPRDFKNTVAKFAPRFITSEQQDAQEFLGFVMDGIHEDLNRVKVHHYIENKDSDGLPHHVAAQRAWELHKKRNDSIIVDLFQGQFRSVVTCMTCKKQSVTFEAFMYLTVPIPKGGNKPTVEDCIRLFAKPEKMEGTNKWFCPNCKCNRDVIKKIEIWKLPPVLLIVLKRFLYHGQWRDKISAYVHYPIHELNMSPYVVGDQQPKNYHLYAITNHTGTLHGGHYTACCRYPYNRNKFYKFDDQEVYEIGTNKLQTAAGYVLFYSSVDFTPPKFGT